MSQRTAGNPPKYPPRHPASSAPSSSSLAAASSAPAAAASTSAAAAPPAAATSFPVGLGLKGAAWCGCWWLACKIEFGAVFLVLSAIVAIFRNLSSDSGGKLSAYSVFNPGARRIAGSMDAESIDDQLRHKARAPRGVDLDVGNPDAKEHYARKSKAANQPCVCGSGKKYKNCCSPLTASDKKLEQEWAEWEEEWAAKR